MFNDRNQALQRLEQALLEEEETVTAEEEQLIEADEDLLSDDVLDELLEDVAPGKNRVPYQNYSNDYGQSCHAYNADTTDTDLEEYSNQVLQDDKKPSYSGLVILACLLSIGILGVIIYLLLRYGGIL